MTPEEREAAALDNIRKSHVHFCTPCYGGNVSERTFYSYMKFAITAMQYGIQFSLDTMVNESLIPRGRNNLVAKFLANEQATHLMWVDADINFEPQSVLRMINHDVDIVCGLYPSKGLPIKYVMNTVPNPAINGSLVEVSTAGTGFMLIKRGLIEELIAAMPELKYKDNLNFGAMYEKHMYALFDTMIDEHGNYLSEDWTFCKRIREVLHKPVWVDTTVELDHIGTYTFKGDSKQIQQIVTDLLTTPQVVIEKPVPAPVSKKKKK